jgi:hypothetical protein
VDFCESTCAPLPSSEQISAIRAFLDRSERLTKTLTARQEQLRAGEVAQKLFKSGRTAALSSPRKDVEMTHDDAGSAPMRGSHGCHPHARLIVSDNSTIDEYRTALQKCVADKAADWKAACDSAEAASKEINRLRLTDEEREAIKAGIANCEDITYGGPNDEEAAAVLRRLLERLG